MTPRQIFFLHFAGGNKYSYKFITPYLKGFDVHCLELPGRGMRMKEDLIRDFDKAVDDYFNQLIKLAGPDFAVYGHSMGAILIPALLKRLENAGKKPCYVFVSGNPGPGIMQRKGRYLLNKAEFKNELTRYGGMPEGLLVDEELFDFFEPVLRADFEVVEKQDDVQAPIITAPVLAMMGSRELEVGSINNWQQYTTGRFSTRIFDGGHFFIYDYAKEIAAQIKECCEQTVPSG